MAACIDTDALAALVELGRDAQDGDLLARLIDRFALEAPARLDRLQAAAAGSDARAMAREAHVLAGSAAAVGALALMQRARRLEQDASLGVPVGLAARLAVIEVELSRTIDELLAYRRAVA